MSAPDVEVQIQGAIDTALAALLAPVPIAFGNTDYTPLSEGELPFVRAACIFNRFKQLACGNTVQHRVYGNLFLVLHFRKNTGDGGRNLLTRKLVNFFRGQKVGGATFLDVNGRASGTSENWAITGLDCPFYYDQMT